MALSISAGLSRMEMAGDESIQVRRGIDCLRRERGDFVSCALSLQHSVVRRCITCAGCHERDGIGAHGVNKVPIVI
jgi:cytochrome c553